MSQGAFGAPYENGASGPASMSNMNGSSLPSLNTTQAPGVGLGTNGIASPTSATSAGGQIRRAAPEPNKRALYVGGLDQRVTEDVLRQIFETAGAVQNVKIIPDKNVSTISLSSSCGDAAMGQTNASRKNQVNLTQNTSETAASAHESCEHMTSHPRG